MGNENEYDQRLPWSFVEGDSRYEPEKIIDSDGVTITCNTQYYPTPMCDDEMKFVVAAVNAHEELERDALRYRFLRSLVSVSAAELDRITDAMDTFNDAIGNPTPVEFDASIDAGLAAFSVVPS